MPRRATDQPTSVAIRLSFDDTPAAIPALVARVGRAGGTLRNLSTVRRLPPTADGTAGAEIEVEIEDNVDAVLAAAGAAKKKPAAKATAKKK